jgi:hypothetical protein
MNNIESIALHLFQLDQAARRHALIRGWQTGIGEQRSTKEPKVEIYETCVALLDVGEREALARLIDKMMPAARIPTAVDPIVPP